MLEGALALTTLDRSVDAVARTAARLAVMQFSPVKLKLGGSAADWCCSTCGGTVSDGGLSKTKHYSLSPAFVSSSQLNDALKRKLVGPLELTIGSDQLPRIPVT